MLQCRNEYEFPFVISGFSTCNPCLSIISSILKRYFQYRWYIFPLLWSAFQNWCLLWLFFYDFFHVIYCTIDLRVCQSLFRLISKLNSLDAHPTNPFVIRVYLSEESVGYCHISQSFLLFSHAHTHTHSVFLGFWFSVTLLTSLILWKNNHCYLKRG